MSRANIARELCIASLISNQRSTRSLCFRAAAGRLFQILLFKTKGATIAQSTRKKTGCSQQNNTNQWASFVQEIPGGKASNTLIPERKIETHLKHYATWNKHSKGLSGARELAGTEAEKWPSCKLLAWKGKHRSKTKQMRSIRIQTNLLRKRSCHLRSPK